MDLWSVFAQWWIQRYLYRAVAYPKPDQSSLVLSWLSLLSSRYLRAGLRPLRLVQHLSNRLWDMEGDWQRRYCAYACSG